MDYSNWPYAESDFLQQKNLAYSLPSEKLLRHILLHWSWQLFS